MARPHWRQAVASALHDPGAAGLGEPDAGTLGAHRAFPLRMPRLLAERAEARNADDPLWRQSWPLAQELAPATGFGTDPLEEADSSPVPGLVRKYRDRVLLLVADACAMHCRFCFRRHGAVAAPGDWAPALAYIQARPEISEAIFSGGDPLMVDDARLAELAERLGRIGHLKRLRLHTRMPVVVPERIDAALLQWIGAVRLRPVVIIHLNHPRELGPEARGALNRLTHAGVALFSQSVLLYGVNDDAETLAALFEGLIEAGVAPYALHLLDRVAGAAHFEVDQQRGLALLAELRRRLPGYAIPRLIRDRGRAGKTVVG